VTGKKKLIEVALPLEAINKASAREKSIRHGHPSTLHLWWARRPLATCRAVLFAALVDDPSSRPKEFPTAEAQQAERRRLFKLMEELVQWESSTDERVLTAARAEIQKSTGGNPPPVLDPFCGGGSIPLEAQRLGLEAYGSDLNPVAVLITKALIEIPPKFAGLSPVNPAGRKDMAPGSWERAVGLAQDVRYYGQWMRERAWEQIGHMYPQVELPPDQGGGKVNVIAWLWARTVKCPNPACGAEMPLVRSFWLSRKKGNRTWVEPVVDKSSKTVRFQVNNEGEGNPPPSPKVGRGAKFRCLVCDQVANDAHIKAEGMAKRMGAQLMAIVAEGPQGRVYLPPEDKQIEVATKIVAPKGLYEELPYEPRAIWCTLYGIKKYRDLFTARQLAALTTFSDFIGQLHQQVQQDAIAAGMADDGMRLDDGGCGAAAYADAVATYLACAVDRGADYWSTICTWNHGRDNIRNTFARQAIPMTWDFAEANPFSDSSGNFLGAVEWIAKVVERLPCGKEGRTRQHDATRTTGTKPVVISTDPPYYDNIGYADLSDFFYVWLRRSLQPVYPSLFRTVLVPKGPELVATPYRFDGDKEQAQAFFEQGLNQAFLQMKASARPEYPLTVYYAFKQADVKKVKDELENGQVLVASTGWETMLTGLIKAGFAITGTWPMRSERSARSVAIGSNALVSSIVLVCRLRPQEAPLATRREFVTALRRELPPALTKLQEGNIAPVDLAQATIGPGMAIFSRYRQVLEADGTPMSVRTALQIINQELDAYFAAQEGELDTATRFCLAWYEQFGLQSGDYGQADVLARAKNTDLARLNDQGILTAAKGQVRLLDRNQLDSDWRPQVGETNLWLATQHLTQRLYQGGEEAAAKLAYDLGSGTSNSCKDLAYRLYIIAERHSWTEDALAYNALVVSWPAIQKKVAALAASGTQVELGFSIREGDR